jgi:hypothetical protein
VRLCPGSGQAIIAAILQGERDPYQLAQRKDERVKASEEEVARSLLTTGAAAPVYLSPDKVCMDLRLWSKLAR